MHRLIALLLALGLATAPGVARGAGPDRVQVGVPGVNVTREFSPHLHVVLKPPPGYEETAFDGHGGTWVGPAYTNASGAVLGSSSISWRVYFEAARGGTADSARRATIQGYPEIESGSVTVAHLVASLDAGAIPAAFVIDALPPDVSARHEAALAFPLGHDVIAVAAFFAGAPFASDQRVGDKSAPDWNHGAVKAALSGLSVEGDLPPARVRAGLDRGHTVTGTVTDAFGDPVAHAAVRLERRVRRVWRTVARAKSGAKGRFAIHAGPPGVYRVVATVARVSKASRRFAG